MYTGIIDHCGEVIAIMKMVNGLHITIKTSFDDLISGESIAVNGICVTVVNPKQHCFECDLSPETLALTNALALRVGQKVNLERSLTLSDRLGGHFVMGHVDTTAEIINRESEQEFTYFKIGRVAPEYMDFIVKKGSIAVNGISLTINEVYDDGFAIMIIPHTLQRTNLNELMVGDKVNLEFDTIARVVVKQLRAQQL